MLRSKNIAPWISNIPENEYTRIGKFKKSPVHDPKNNNGNNVNDRDI